MKYRLASIDLIRQLFAAGKTNEEIEREYQNSLCVVLAFADAISINEQKATQSAILAEREECAKICVGLAWEDNCLVSARSQMAVDAIRARSQSAPPIGDAQKRVIPPGMKVQFADNGLLVALPDVPQSSNEAPDDSFPFRRYEARGMR